MSNKCFLVFVVVQFEKARNKSKSVMFFSRSLRVSTGHYVDRFVRQSVSRLVRSTQVRVVELFGLLQERTSVVFFYSFLRHFAQTSYMIGIP